MKTQTRTVDELQSQIRQLIDRVQFHGDPISDEPLEFLRELQKDLEGLDEHADCLSQDDCDTQVRDAESIIEDARDQLETKLRNEIDELQREIRSLKRDCERRTSDLEYAIQKERKKREVKNGF